MTVSIRRVSFAMLALATSLATLPAAAQETAPAAPAAPVEPTPRPAPETVIATIDGQPITEGDIILAEADLDQQFSRLPPDQKRAAALSAIIEIRLMAARATADGLDKDAEVQRRLAFLQSRALHSIFIEKQISGAITDEEVRASYDKQIADTPPVNEVHARHILVKTQEEAVELIKQLDGGAKFEDLANQHTTDPSGKTSGGDLGYFGPNQMVPEFEKAAFSLDVGSYTKEPVQTQFGWHIIKVEDKRAQQPPAFDEVKDRVRSIVLQEKYFAKVKELKDAAKIDISDADLKKAIDAQNAAAP